MPCRLCDFHVISILCKSVGLSIRTLFYLAFQMKCIYFQMTDRQNIKITIHLYHVNLMRKIYEYYDDDYLHVCQKKMES